MKVLFSLVVIIYWSSVCKGENSELINPFSLRNDQISLLKLSEKKQEELRIKPEELLKEEIKPVKEKELEKEKELKKLEKEEKEVEEIPPSFAVTQPRPLLQKKPTPALITTPKLPQIPLPSKILLPSKIEDKISQIQIQQELPTTKPKPSPEVLIKEIKVKDTRLRMINLVMWGLFSIIGIILLGVYIVSRRRESGLSLRLLFPPRSTQLDTQLRQLRIGYKGIERVLADLEGKLGLVEELSGESIRDFTQNIVKEALVPFADTLNKFGQSNKDLELIVEEMREKLLPIADLKGVNIVELIRKISNQSALEVNKPLEEKLELIKAMHKRYFTEFEEKIDKKLVQTLKKFRSIEKYALELDKKVGSLDSQVATLSVSQEAQQIIGPRKIPTTQEEEKEEQIKKEESSQRAKLHELIYKLSEEGLGIDEIAEKTKLGKGEIKLILSLKKKE